MVTASPAEIRAWVTGRRVAAARERAEQQLLDPETAWRRGLAMIALAARLHGWPLPERERDVAQDLEAYRRWARLRRRMVSNER
jgi:hypothetical protein